ncbi:MAG: cation:proton antiporter [Planctomycetales bacterium]|nr:cation:proton antiporter [Planctomycetales bacterium]
MTTFVVAAALGVLLFSLAASLRTSAITLLLVGGIAAGPQGFAIVDPAALGKGLPTLVSLAVAIILFEGGLTLDLGGYRRVSKEIIRILTIGVIVTWVGTASFLRLLFGFDWSFCLLSASLVIVTGPTVIGPILHRIRVKERLHHILHWEGVLIDPIGVFIALLCFEFYISTDSDRQLVLQVFLLRFLVGAALGISFGFMLDQVLRRDWINKGHVNIFVLAMAMLNFWLADLIISESGLLSVTIAGLVLGSRSTPQLREIVSYKVELKDFLIGLLFVLLAANLELRSFWEYGWRLCAVVAAIMLIVRPVNVLVSMSGSTLTGKEKLFLCWIAPRGIVAASMASVFALQLENAGVQQSVFVEAFTYSVIVGTVIVQGFSAGLVGRCLGVVRAIPNGWLIVGAHSLARSVAEFMRNQGVPVLMVDTNAREVREAKRIGLNAISDDAMQIEPDKHSEFYGCGNLLALTPNPDLNRMLCHRWSELLEGDQLLRWERSGYETNENKHLLSGKTVWSDLPLNQWMNPACGSPPLRVQKNDGLPPACENVLLTVRNGNLITGTPTTIADQDELWFVYDSLPLQNGLPLKANNVVFSDARELKELYRAMLYHLQGQLPRIAPEEMLIEIWKREEDYTSLLGHGIALPHTWTDAVDQSTLMVARPNQPLCCTLTGRQVEIIFMLLSPIDSPKDHLEILSQIAKLIGPKNQRSRILKASDPMELFRLIVSH